MLNFQILTALLLVTVTSAASVSKHTLTSSDRRPTEEYLYKYQSQFPLQFRRHISPRQNHHPFRRGRRKLPQLYKNPSIQRLLQCLPCWIELRCPRWLHRPLIDGWAG